MGNGVMKPSEERMNVSTEHAQRLLSRDRLPIGEGGRSESSKAVDKYTRFSTIIYWRNKTRSACRTGSLPASLRWKKSVTTNSRFSHTGGLRKSFTSCTKC